MDDQVGDPREEPLGCQIYIQIIRTSILTIPLVAKPVLGGTLRLALRVIRRSTF